MDSLILVIFIIPLSLGSPHRAASLNESAPGKQRLTLAFGKNRILSEVFELPWSIALACRSYLQCFLLEARSTTPAVV